MTPLELLNFLWTLWLVAWLVAARWTAKTVLRQSAAARLTHGLLVAAGAMLLFARPGRLGPLLRPLFPATPWTAWAGVLLCAVGLGFAAWARVLIGRFWSGSVVLKADHALIRVGPYALTRHPIYSGLLLALTGTALARDSLGGLLGLALLFAGAVVKLRQEERLLLEHFGPAYQAYRAEVPALIPRI
ncbi:MAG TPA: isoprenylcysteine carboxylmethyltransferase family protein [Vicinamibacteria bacterium]